MASLVEENATKGKEVSENAEALKNMKDFLAEAEKKHQGEIQVLKDKFKAEKEALLAQIK